MIASLILLPIFAGFLLYAFPRSSEGSAKAAAVGASLYVFVFTAMSSGAPDVRWHWLSRPFTANFHFGLGSGPSFWIALLLGLTTFCALVSTRVPRQRDFCAQMLFLLGSMMGLFLARDLLVFAFFFDLMLVPVFLILVSYAPGKSGTSAWKYLIFNLAGGLALLLATAAYGMIEGTTDLIGLAIGPAAPAIGPLWGPWIFAGFALAFLIKTPVWPFHTWMPATYADLPPPAVAVVSAVQSKAGLYGFLVVTSALMPTYMHAAANAMIVLGLIGVIYGAVCALVQDDSKLVVGYSSLSHLGLIVVAIFSFNPIALGGALVYIVAHGLFSAGLFIALGAIEAREETRLLHRLTGLGVRNPQLAGAIAIMALAALGLPGLAGFAGEIVILTGLYQAGFGWPALIALVSVVLAAAYLLRLYQKIMHGPPHADLPERGDMTPLEFLALAPLVLALVFLGFNPAPLIHAQSSVIVMRALVPAQGDVSLLAR